MHPDNRSVLEILALLFDIQGGAVAQLVEQRTENPCVAGSIPAHTTSFKVSLETVGLFYFWWTTLSLSVGFRYGVGTKSL